jgi:hypothetical protein
MAIHYPDLQSNPPDLIVRSGRESLPLEVFLRGRERG